MTGHTRTPTGRRGAPSAYCQGCGVRLTKGDPRVSESWPLDLTLDARSHHLLLQAAAEYDCLSAEAETDDPESAVDFIDWLGSVLRQGHIHPDHDGGRLNLERDGFGRAFTHRQPDPIPFASLPRTWRKQ